MRHVLSLLLLASFSLTAFGQQFEVWNQLRVEGLSRSERRINNNPSSDASPPVGTDVVIHTFTGAPGTEFGDVVTDRNSSIGGGSPVWATGGAKARQRVNGADAYCYQRSKIDLGLTVFFGITGVESRAETLSTGNFGWFDGGHGLPVGKDIRFSGLAYGSGEGNGAFPVLQLARADVNIGTFGLTSLANIGGGQYEIWESGVMEDDDPDRARHSDIKAFTIIEGSQVSMSGNSDVWGHTPNGGPTHRSDAYVNAIARVQD